jgi:hypothetical protein
MDDKLKLINSVDAFIFDCDGAERGGARRRTPESDARAGPRCCLPHASWM